MGKFSGYLICSDIDGTLSVNAVPVKKNIEAIKYFTKTGGRFSIATGRTAAYLKNTEFYNLINAPACICNGSAVYDYSADKALRLREEDFTLGEFLDAAQPLIKSLEGLYIYFTYKTVQAPNTAGSKFSESELSSKPIKVVCTFDEIQKASDFKAHCQNHPLFKNTFISKSWDTGLEFNSLDGTKGSAVEFIKEHLCGIHTSVAIGDYENDIPMLQKADIAVCVGDGLPEVKNNADIIVCSASDGAVANLIEILDTRLK